MTKLSAVALGAIFIAMTSLSQTGNPGGPLNQNLGDPDYGVCRGLDPNCYHNWGALPKTDFRVLMYSRTMGPRHANLGPPLAAGLNPPLQPANVVHASMVKLAAANGFGID